ncbi:hypothetical protein KRR40_17900 [Niabella defluvii]|nr:hypothetical protein KRR40_17900 [Niabella sp. I65]
MSKVKYMKLISTALLLIYFNTAAISQDYEPLFICGQTEAEYPGGLALRCGSIIARLLQEHTKTSGRKIL